MSTDVLIVFRPSHSILEAGMTGESTRSATPGHLILVFPSTESGIRTDTDRHRRSVHRARLPYTCFLFLQLLQLALPRSSCPGTFVLCPPCAGSRQKKRQTLAILPMFRLLTAPRPPEQLHRTHTLFLLQQTVSANAITLPATTTGTGTVSGGTVTTASTAEVTAETASATTPAGTLSGTGNASPATGIVTATEGVAAVKTTTSTRDVIATTTAGASAEGEVVVVVVVVELQVQAAWEVTRSPVVGGSAGPLAVAATTTGASGRGGGGTETGWGHLRGGLRRRRKQCPCRRGSGRRVGGTCTLLGTSSTRPCRRSKQVSDAAYYPYGYTCASGAVMRFAVEADFTGTPYLRVCVERWTQLHGTGD